MLSWQAGHCDENKFKNNPVWNLFYAWRYNNGVYIAQATGEVSESHTTIYNPDVEMDNDGLKVLCCNVSSLKE